MMSDVAIIGYGPVGATLANLLGQLGVAVTVLEREGAAYHLPRAVHFDDEVMRVFQSIGLADDILPFTHLSPGMKFVGAKGELLIDWPRPAEVGPLGWYPSYRFHQPDLERVLRAGLARYPDVDVKTRCDVFAIDERADGVTIRFEDLTSGRLERLHARYVVGCDGARSLVRRLMDVPLRDLKSHERWLVVDLLLKRPRDDLGDHSIQFCDPEGPGTYVRGIGIRRRWELMLRPDEDTNAATAPEQVWRRLSRWITPADADLERATVYTFHSVVAETWRRGPLMLAGDSAHQTPPFLGQGLCAGIRDAANLGWKLARVVQGKSDAALLDSYESERAPHVREFIELAVRLGSVIQTRDPAVAAQRDAEMALRPVRLESIKPRLGPGLHGDRAEPAGRIGAQPRLADGRRLDDAVGLRAVALLRPDFCRSLPAAGLAALQRKDVAVIADEGAESARWLAALDAQGVVLRPDRYVLGVIRDPGDVPSLASALP
jgi:3-(3-hydroxy-phenyl)propionate hydroxylase